MIVRSSSLCFVRLTIGRGRDRHSPAPLSFGPTLVRRAALVIVASTAPARPPNHAAIAPRRSAIEANRAPRDTDLAATSAAWVVTRSRASISFWRCPGNTPRMRGYRDAPHMSPVTPAEEARTILLNKVSCGGFLLGPDPADTAAHTAGISAELRVAIAYADPRCSSNSSRET
jgi:hypothetical protein